MTIKSKLTGSGMAPLAATNIVGGVDNNLTATGNNQGTALAVTNDINICTTVAASTGVILRSDLSAGDSQVVVNHGANSLSVYPPVGGKIANGSTNAALALGTTKAGTYTCIDNLNFLAEISA